MSFKDKVGRIILRYNMFAPGARIAAAVSGGADSVCLLHVLIELAAEWNLSLAVAHFNHRLRFSESDEDQGFVEALAARWGLPCYVRSARAGAREEPNLEQWARSERMEFFRVLIAEGRCERVATGHTRSDQAETVLYRFLRGSHTAGIAGIRPALEGGIVRPLLAVERAEVEQYLRERGISWRNDSSNRDPAFARNRIRHHALPELAARFNPRLPDALARHAELALEDEEYWTAEVERHLPGRLTLGEQDAILDVPALLELPGAMRRRLIRRALLHIRGNLREIEAAHVEAVLDLAGAAGHARVQLPGVDVVRSFEWVRFAPLPVPPRESFRVPLPVPGSAAVPGAVIRTEVVADARDTLNESLDWIRVRESGAPLFARNWFPGDRYRRTGHSHEQKLKELFHDFRVPLWERRRWPVVECAGRVLWARRFGVSADFAAAPGCRDVLVISEGEA